MNRPEMVLFNAISLDGCTTGFDIDFELFYRVARGFGEDTTLAGCDTLLSATPEDWQARALAAPTPGNGPRLVVVDSRARLDSWPYWLAQPMWQRWSALGSALTPPEALERLGALGVETACYGDDKVDLAAALAALRQEGVRRVRVESGGGLNGALINAGLVDELHLLLHPVLAGGMGGPRFAEGLAPDLPGFTFVSVSPEADGTVLLSYSRG